MADLRIPEDKASEVLELAARLYAWHQQSYSLEPRKTPLLAADIPPEFIQRALSQLQAREEEALELRQRAKRYRQGMTLAGIAAGLALLSWCGLAYSRLANAARAADQAWYQVDNALQQRADLLPPLIAAAQAEPALAALLTKAQQSAQSASTQVEKVAAAAAVDQAVELFQTAAIALPQLQSSGVADLQGELTHLESQIAANQLGYNQTALQYNQQIQAFPTSLLAGILGFQPKPLLTVASQHVSVRPPEQP